MIGSNNPNESNNCAASEIIVHFIILLCAMFRLLVNRNASSEDIHYIPSIRASAPLVIIMLSRDNAVNFPAIVDVTWM